MQPVSIPNVSTPTEDASVPYLEIRQFPDSMLRRAAVPFIEPIAGNENIAGLLASMAKTMTAYNAVGLAGPQVGFMYRVFVIRRNNGQVLKCINPQITARRNEQPGTEGCLSFPGVELKVKRAKEATLRYMDLKGEFQTAELFGLEAVAAQHELDHLDGKTFLDHVAKFVRSTAIKTMNDFVKRIVRQDDARKKNAAKLQKERAKQVAYNATWNKKAKTFSISDEGIVAEPTPEAAQVETGT